MTKKTTTARNENPGARSTGRAEGTTDTESKDKDEPWISNYPPLYEFLHNNNARCDWQLRYGKGRDGFMLECWRLPGSMQFIVQVYSKQMGWEIYTPSSNRAIEATLADTRARIFPGSSMVFKFQMPEGWSPEQIEAFTSNVLTQARVSGDPVVLEKP